MSIRFFTRHRILRDQRGVTSIEYAAIAGIISVAAVSAMPVIGERVSDSFTNTKSAFSGKIAPPAPKTDGTPA